MKNRVRLPVLVIFITMMISGCISDNGNDVDEGNEVISIDRESKIPENAIKVSPENDEFPPILHSDEFFEPVQLPYPINTAGGEDSCFIMPDGKTLYFWFTPDVSIPAEKQLLDGVTGIYGSKYANGTWSVPERILLQDQDKLAIDGCPFVQDGIMWFCSAREGYVGVNMFTAELIEDEWKNWTYTGELLNEVYEVGEMHIAENGQELYFHSARDGGKGGYDIWVSLFENGQWQPPENIGIVNTNATEGWPFVTEDGKELWFLRTYMGSPAIYRSIRVGGEWQAPELIISQFAAEPSLDRDGNLYFVHHFFSDGVMIEADIYVAMKK